VSCYNMRMSCHKLFMLVEDVCVCDLCLSSNLLDSHCVRFSPHDHTFNFIGIATFWRQ
jgi:hypothetical protein